MGHGQRGRAGVRGVARWAVAACVVSACVAGPGCRQGAVVREGARAYPEALRQGETLNVQVFRDGTNIELTNTTARRIEGGTMWLNKWFGREVEAIGPGESRRLALKEFKDAYGQSFRAGGFFATRIPDILVLAQVETGGELLGLIVVENRIE